MAAVLACGPGAVLSHVSAAALHGLLSTARTNVDVTIPRRVGISRPGINVHRSTCLEPADLVEAKAVPCTSVARTLLDLATVVNHHTLERACEQAEVLRRVDWSAIDRLLSTARGRPGVRRLGAVLRVSEIGDHVPRSELERAFLALCHRASLPSPGVNVWLSINGEEMQVDFVWHGPRVVVETDGFRTHGTRWAFREDRRRDRLLGLGGWRVVRFTWADVTNEPDHVIGVLRAMHETVATAR